MSKKALRIAAIKTNLDEGLEVDEVVALISEEFGVKEDTILKDIAVLEDGSENDYDVPEGEENSVHAEVEAREWEEGKKISKPYIHKTDVNSWKLFLKNRASVGLRVNKILHAPKGTEMLVDPEGGWALTKAEKAAKEKAGK